MPEEITALSIAGKLQEIYNEFTDSIRSMGGRKNGRRGRSRLGSSVLHWIAGSHVKTERDLLCDKFVQDVESCLQDFDYALEGVPEEEAQAACAAAADILVQAIPAGSNSTTDLMKRAMIGHVKPYLARLSQDKLAELLARVESSYPRRQRLPVEQEVLKEIKKLQS